VLEFAASELAGDPDREPVAVAMQDVVSGPASAVPLFLRAAAAEGRGDAAGQLALLEAAVDADPRLTCAVEDLAELCSVRGDAQAARRWYERAGVDSAYPDYVVLRRFLKPAEGEVGRNRPCPCGSGRKYKMCHGQDLRHPFPQRAEWMWTKVVTFALRPRQRDVVMAYAELLADGEDGALSAAFHDGLAHDLALFDGGLLSRFLDERGALLPDDERALAESWLDSARRLLEVVEVRPLRRLRCRDLLTGEVLEVLDSTMPGQLEELDLVYGRPLPDGDGGLRVRDAPRLLPRMMRSRLLSLLRAGAPGEDIAELFAPHSGQPALRTSEGEDMVMCTAAYDVDDLDAVWGRLGQQGLEETGDDELTETAPVAGRGDVVRGTIRRRDGRITVEANAVERIRRLQDVVLAADPTARLVDESAVPMEEALSEYADSAGAEAAPPESGLPPEVAQQVLAEVMRRHEETWPDIELPALDGRTPRQAASDPELRPDLEALLDDFAWAQ
ncbi:MAG: SEC-C metal-binding domain-containing protein, partial [Thermocrispum sp.]